jgi:hypothetical protein
MGTLCHKKVPVADLASKHIECAEILTRCSMMFPVTVMKMTKHQLLHMFEDNEVSESNRAGRLKELGPGPWSNTYIDERFASVCKKQVKSRKNPLKSIVNSQEVRAAVILRRIRERGVERAPFVPNDSPFDSDTNIKLPEGSIGQLSTHDHKLILKYLHNNYVFDDSEVKITEIREYTRVNFNGVLFRPEYIDTNYTTMNCGAKIMFIDRKDSKKYWYGKIQRLTSITLVANKEIVYFAKFVWLDDVDKYKKKFAVDRLRKVRFITRRGGESSEPWVEMKHIHQGNILYWPRKLNGDRTRRTNQFFVVELDHIYQPSL